MVPISARAMTGGWPSRRRLMSSFGAHQSYHQRRAGSASSTAMYATAVAVATLGVSYASVPLYRLFCQATGYGGTVQTKVEDKLKALADSGTGLARTRSIIIEFNADTSATMPWRFAPAQKNIRINVGDTALAFYRAKNTLDRAVTGVASYNVTPMKAALYFNKIQCFCFEEQRLRPQEEIELPVFFFLDPAMLDDPKMIDISKITLSYTFFPVEDKEENEISAMISPDPAGTSEIVAAAPS